MPLHIYLPIAHQSLSLFLIVGAGFIVGLLSGLFGVGGGFLLTPLLIMFGIPPTVAAASDLNQIVAASASGSFAHYRMGNVDFKMGIYLLIGGIIGGTGGVQVIKVLRQMGNADFLIKVTYVLMLGLVAGYMLLESLQAMRANQTAQTSSKATGQGQAATEQALTVSPGVLEINSGFNGGRVTISGTLKPLENVVIQVTGRDTETSFELKGKTGPLWMTKGKVHIANVPEIYLLLLPEINQWVEKADDLGAGIAHLKKRMEASGSVDVPPDIFSMFAKLKKMKGCIGKYPMSWITQRKATVRNNSRPYAHFRRESTEEHIILSPLPSPKTEQPGR